MANRGTPLTPAQTSALQAFAAKYPDFNFNNSDPTALASFAGQFANGPDAQQKFADFQRLKQILGPALDGAHFASGGDIQPDMPWWKKALLGASVLAAPFAIGSIGSLAGAAGPTAYGATGPGIVAGTGLDGVDLAGMGGGAAAGSLGSTLARYGIPTGVNAATNLYGAHQQISANDRAAQLQAQTAANSLAFLKEQEDTRHSEWQIAQDRNKQLYDEGLARLAPYRAMGSGALAQLGQPIPGSIGSFMGRG